jgi:aromatic-L-amino-acid decarboxylase
MSEDRNPSSETRAALRRAADLVADYLERVESYPVLARVRPGEIRARLAASPPERGEPLEGLLADYAAIIEPNCTHWNHPGFMAYFATSATVPGIIGEFLVAGINAQAMLWRTGPAATELEEVATDWLRQMLGLPEPFRGHINDTASSSTMLALAAARHRASPAVREHGLGRAAPMVVYASEHAHSSVEKAAITLGLGTRRVRKVACDERFALRPAALEAAIVADRAAGLQPIAVVATVGTTSSSAVDPVRACGAIAAREGLWLHVDAAQAGPAAICPEFRVHFEGWEGADSIVVNPHKWLFTPMDCSTLYLRDVEALRAAFSLVPEYLRVPESGVTNLSELGPQLGRRFRALKLWFVIRSMGQEGIRERLRLHCSLAREFASMVESEPGFEVVAPVPFSTVCFRAVAPLAPASPDAEDAFNERVMHEVNAAGPVFISHTRLGGRLVLRLSIGNAATERRHMVQAWELLRGAARDSAVSRSG